MERIGKMCGIGKVHGMGKGYSVCHSVREIAEREREREREREEGENARDNTTTGINCFTFYGHFCA